MSTRRSGPAPQIQPQLSLSYGEPERKQRSKCMTFVCCMWKVFTCIFSHVTLVATVVAYCFLGAFTFEHLEAENERNVKKGISSIRENLTDSIWKMTNDRPVLHQQNWTSTALSHLQSFEKEILTAMKKDGWDGNEDVNQIQWTFFGALFYSIIVITTIGYGHIAPKTAMGKISTIFYAILGIPLMLLCLSNIGDIMASSFRFLYWRVCCYVCTREPKRPSSRRSRNSRGTVRQSRSSMRTGQGPGTLRRSHVPGRNSQRSADSGFDPYYEPGLSHSYSDTDCRYNAAMEDPYYTENDRRGNHQANQSLKYDTSNSNGAGGQRQKMRGPSKADMFIDDEYLLESQSLKRPPTQSRAESVVTDHSQRSLQKSRLNEKEKEYRKRPSENRAQSMDRRIFQHDSQIDEDSPCKTPILCNKYAIDNHDEPVKQTRPNPRSQSMPRQTRYGDRLLPDRLPYYTEDNELAEMQTVRKSMPRRREPRPVPAPSPRIMSPMGFAVHRQARHLQNVMDDNSIYDDEWDMHSGELPPSSIVRPVPIWLCVFLVVSYIIAGAFMFSEWEEWSFLDSAYFCFITLTTIGFGDFVPAQGVKNDSEVSIALCSLYLLFGIALLAMSFNLVQEEVISNVKSVARRLGILKEEEMDD
ncbi:uncharacterized protein LOC126576184 [Anopheles aquasalis]|uniref:uncharacterized protein LOC126576184 n=1 Tax=Anopheles aquasalis TaxID=42839 RepID=UPI00215AF86A|nr:uncharacterized protein LOC126576184 [Anopheles aquasalis]